MKNTTKITLASAVALGGIALGAAALPAMAETATPSPSASSSSGTSGSTSKPSVGSTDRTADRTQHIKDDLAGLVADGTLTQAQADKVAETLAATMPAGGHGGRGGHGGGFGGLTAAATAIGISEDELRTQLQAGKSIAEVAEAEGVSEQAVIDAMVTAAKDHFAAEVASGEHTQAEVDQKLADVETRVKQMVEQQGMPMRGGHDGDNAPSTSTAPSASSSSAT